MPKVDRHTVERRGVVRLVEAEGTEVHRDGAYHERCEDTDGRRGDLAQPCAPGARPQHRERPAECNGHDAERHRLQVAEHSRDEEPDSDQPAPVESAVAQRHKRDEAPKGRADMPRALQEVERECVARETEQRDDSEHRDECSFAGQAVARGEGADDDDEESDRCGHERDHDWAEADQRDADGVEHRVNAPERVEGKGPATQTEVSVRDRPPFENDGS